MHNNNFTRTYYLFLPLFAPLSLLGMGGVDLHDNALGNYRIGIRGKKWWWPLFTNTLSNMMVNAWKLHCLVAKNNNSSPMPQLEFRCQVTRALLTSEKNVQNASRDRPEANINDTKHFPGKRGVDVPPRRCKVCSSKTPFICVKCNVNLHAKCFGKYYKHH